MTTENDDSIPIGCRELVRHNADFRWLWFGQIVSLLGDWFNMIATVALLASLTGSGFAVGGVFVVRMLAPFFTSPIAGVVADRYDRRKILVVADLVRGVVVVGMLFVRSPSAAWMLYVLTALQLGTSSFFVTARNAILPDIVSRNALGAANTIGSVTWSVMLALGAALGGLIAGWLGVYSAFAIDAATFFVSALLVAQIRPQPRKVSGNGLQFATAIADYRHGLAFLLHHVDILAISLQKPALTMLFGTTFRVVQTRIAEHVFPLGEEGAVSMGLIMAVSGIGTGLGPVVARHFAKDRQRSLQWAMLAAYLIGGIGLAITSSLTSLSVVLIGALLAGIGNGILWVFSTQLILLTVPTEVRGRVFGTEFAMFALAGAIGSAAVGWGMDTWLGIIGVLRIMIVTVPLPAVLWFTWIGSQTVRRSS